MTIVLLLEGETERVLVNKIREFLNEVADAESKQRPKLRSQQVDGLSQVRIGKQIKRNLETPDVSAVAGISTTRSTRDRKSVV